LVRRQPGSKNLSDEDRPLTDSVESISRAWPRPTRFPALPEKGLHVWLIDLSRSTPETDGEGILGPEEVERAARLRSERARSRFRSSHLAMRKILAGYLGRRPGALAFQLGEAGKPRLSGGEEGDPHLWFNLSHSGDIALCAVSTCGEIGVDVEEVTPLRDVERLATRHFSPEELVDWQALDGSKRLDGFYRVWTRKEALLKAAGLGLSRPLERVDTRAGILDEVTYWLCDLALPGSFRGAVACVESPVGLECWKWENPPASTRGS